MKKSHYFDNASSTKMAPEVLKAMLPYLKMEFGNPSSQHQAGFRARQAIESSRGIVAGILGGKPQEIIFTSGGTESINLAILGVAKQYLTQYKTPGQIISTTIEHESVLQTLKYLQTTGWQIDLLQVNTKGQIYPDQVKTTVKPNTALVTIMYANNEIGTILPIPEIGSILTSINRRRAQQKQSYIVFHTDACQASSALDLNIQKLKVDLLSLNGSKIYGPKGVGVLYKKSHLIIQPLMYGGGQEFGLRSGTENTASIVGFATALKLVNKARTIHTNRLLLLQNYLEKQLHQKISNIKINGPINLLSNKIPLLKLPNLTNILIKNLDGESVVLYLDASGFQIATGSACATHTAKPSPVLTAIGIPEKDIKSAIRISINHNTTKIQINQFIKALGKIIQMLRHTTQDL